MKILLRPAEAAETLSISPRLLWQLTSDGAIPRVTIGRSVRYRREDLEAFATRLAKPATDRPQIERAVLPMQG